MWKPDAARAARAVVPALLLACSEGGGPSPDGPLQVVPDRLNMLPTRTVLLTVPNAGGPVTWSSDDEAVASVSPGGLLTSVGIGSATITATEGSRSGSATVTVQCSFDPRGPSLRSEGQLNFHFVDFGATPETLDTSFHAVKGADREVTIYLESLLDGTRGEDYFSLHIGPSGLGFLPDGTPIESGDSVLITVHVDVDTRTQFDLLPRGLRPEPGSAVGEVRIRYAREHIPYSTIPDPVREQCQLAAFGLWAETDTDSLWELRPAEDLVAADSVTGVLVSLLDRLRPVGVAYYGLEF